MHKDQFASKALHAYAKHSETAQTKCLEMLQMYFEAAKTIFSDKILELLKNSMKFAHLFWFMLTA